MYTLPGLYFGKPSVLGGFTFSAIGAQARRSPGKIFRFWGALKQKLRCCTILHLLMSAKHMLSKSMCKPHYARALSVPCTALWYTQHFATAKINKYLQIFINHFKLLIEHLINTNCSLHIFAWLGFRGALLLAFSTVVSV